MKRRAGGPVQQWIDSIPLSMRSEIAVASECREEEIPKPTDPKDIPFSKDSKLPSMTISAPINVPSSPAMSAPPTLPSSLPHQRLARDASFQSDSSRCSSVESLLELRKADPTAILLDLGFGGCTACPQEDGPLSRIPKRFLQPSSLPGIAIDEFLKQQQETSESFDSVSLGYRGLTGSPHVAPSEIVQKIMERLREHESHEADTSLYNYEQYSPICQNGMLSVLSPDNRQFLEQPRSKSPDMRNKRMIIGQKSFAFGCDGNLIELPSDTTKPTSGDAEDNHNNSGISEEFVESKQSPLEENITLEHRTISRNDKKLTKQLSFEFVETEQLPTSDRETPSNSHVAQSETNAHDNGKECNESSSVTSKCKKYEFPDIRSSSDGSFRIESSENKIFDEGRRFSDGAVRTSKSLSTDCMTQKRKSFKRQPRIYDTTVEHRDPSPISFSVSNAISESHVSCESEVSNDVSLCDNTRKLNVPILVEPTENKTDTESKVDTESLSEEPNCTSSASKLCQSITKVERFGAAEEDTSSDHSSAENKICCFKGKICKHCKQSKNCPECGCHVEKQKYLKKIDKIMQKNKKLEAMLARSRKEMAEIRDMLSSVLSVRMEPGF